MKNRDKNIPLLSITAACTHARNTATRRKIFWTSMLVEEWRKTQYCHRQRLDAIKRILVGPCLYFMTSILGAAIIIINSFNNCFTKDFKGKLIRLQISLSQRERNQPWLLSTREDMLKTPSTNKEGIGMSNCQSFSAFSNFIFSFYILI